MEIRRIPIIALAVFAVAILLNQEIINAYAVSVISITFATGTTTRDASYVKIAEGSGTNAQAYVVGENGGQAFIWSKPSNSDTITNNRTLTGSSSAQAVQHHAGNGFIYVATNDKFYKISPSLAISGQFATAQATTTIDFQYDEINQLLYFCYNDGYGTLNTVTLNPTVLYNDAVGVNAIFGCSLDVSGGAMYLTGDTIGTSGGDIIKISLSTHTQSASVGIADFFYGNCVDTKDHEVWALESSQARVRKYDSSLNQLVLVTVGTTPRHCSISDDSGARRLYVANEGTNNISIVDIDADVVITTPSVCDTVAGRKLDTFRGLNTTRTFVTCNSNINSIVLDDTVSEGQFDNTPVCIDTNPLEDFVSLTCFTDTNGDGIPDSQVGEFPTVGQNTTSLVHQIACQAGIADCNNTDSKTNGMGLLLLLMLLIMAIGAIMFVTFRTDHSLSDIHPVVWFILVVACTGVSWQLGWTDAIPFFGSIVAICALGAFKVREWFG